jgi:hypothetical protein
VGNPDSLSKEEGTRTYNDPVAETFCKRFTFISRSTIRKDHLFRSQVPCARDRTFQAMAQDLNFSKLPLQLGCLEAPDPDA